MHQSFYRNTSDDSTIKSVCSLYERREGGVGVLIRVL